VSTAKHDTDGPGWRYNLLLALLSPILLFHVVWISANARNWRFCKERFGYCPRAESSEEWWHAASVGEVQTVWPLLLARLDTQLVQNSQVQFLVSTNTVTGYEVLQQRIQLAGLERIIHHCFMPVDTQSAVKRFLKRRIPNRMVVVETELWPQLFNRLHKQKTPITIVNARMTDRTSNTVHTSHRLASTLAPAYRSALHGVQVLARSDIDAKRFIGLGANSTQLSIIGNLKFADNRPKRCKAPLDVNSLQQPYVVAASTHAPEEIQLASHWMQMTNNGLLVIVPRHIDRADKIQQRLIADHGSAVAERRSLGGVPNTDHRIYLADTLGELHDWYAGAAVAFVGGSLIERGGHNVLEPHFHGVPVIAGPHTFNFAEAMAWLLQQKQVHVANDAGEAVELLVHIRDSQPMRTQAVMPATTSAKPNILKQYLVAIESTHTL